MSDVYVTILLLTVAVAAVFVLIEATRRFWEQMRLPWWKE